jgi:hypothetical protein
LKRIAITLLITVVLSPSISFAQTRGRSSRPRPSAQPAQRVSAARTAGAQKVADQIKNLTKFIYLYGGIANGLASVDEAARRNEAPPALVQQNQQRKAMLKQNIAAFREAMDKLEIEFRNTPDLQPYYIKLAGVAAGAATSEEQAAAGQFDQAGRKLLDVINRLADVLVVMRQ